MQKAQYIFLQQIFAHLILYVRRLNESLNNDLVKLKLLCITGPGCLKTNDVVS